MIPELGHFALIVALCLAIILGVVPLVGTFRQDDRMMAMARPLATGQFVFVLFAFVCLIYCFVTSDFSVKNVAANSNTKLPVYYKITASWGSHEGSLLLWVLMLAGWTFAVSVFSRNLPQEVIARVLSVMGLIAIGFFLFMLLTSNPFERLVPAVAEGRDLNPLLQDPGMIYHPPMLYMGYVGFSVAFAFAVAALIGAKLDATWARWSRPWTTAAWIFLTLGIALGSAWAYYELGWGGWWFWDPVENASFMPWLVGTALIHSLAVTEKRGIFKSWTVLLAIIAFSLSLLGTFLVRSGVLTSVHAFATDPARGAFILGFLVVVTGASLALYAWRAPQLGLAKIPGAFTPASRESMLLANNVLLLVAMLAVMLGTLYPLFLDALNMGKISVGPPYFDAVFYPLMAPALFLMAVGPIAAWRNATLPDLWTRLKWALGAAIGCAVVTPFLMGKWTPLIALGLLLAFWIIAASFAALIHRIRSTAGQGLLTKLRANSASYYGMHLAHIGMAVLVIGITLVRGYESERDVRMAPGDSVSEGGYTFKFMSVGARQGPNFDAIKGVFEVSQNGKVVHVLHPEKRTYFASGQTMTEAAIDSGITRDLYVSLGEPVESVSPDNPAAGAWAVRIYVKPFIDWIWAGCILMALGGAFAIGDKRYRVRLRQPATQPSPSASPASKGTESAAGCRMSIDPAECSSVATGDAATRGVSTAKRAWQFFLPLAIFVTLVWFLYQGLFLNPREVPSALINQPAPAFSLATLHAPEQKFSPAEMKGKVWLLNVWGSWCASCRYEHPFLNDLAKQQVVPVVGFNWKDDPSAAKGWLVKYGDPYQLSVSDLDGRVAIDWGVYGAPETFIIDKAGMIRYKHTGPIDATVLAEKLLPLIRDLQRAS